MLQLHLGASEFMTPVFKLIRLMGIDPFIGVGTSLGSTIISHSFSPYQSAAVAGRCAALELLHYRSANDRFSKCFKTAVQAPWYAQLGFTNRQSAPPGSNRPRSVLGKSFS
jgi:hypothetical protein